jgi:hypothetical protein
MKRPCPCCYKLILKLTEPRSERASYHGNYDYGVNIIYDTDERGSIINNNSICPNGIKLSVYA